jgi:hypothetical protein
MPIVGVEPMLSSRTSIPRERSVAAVSRTPSVSWAAAVRRSASFFAW